jgi:hypothetical protein
MTNANIMHNLLSFYTRRAYTDNYVFGFVAHNMVYAVSIQHADDILPFIMKLDKASRGQGFSLRFKPDKAQKTLLLSKGATPVCSEQMFDNMVADSKYNRGEIFEKLVTEQMFGQVWEKDNVPYTDGGDVEESNGRAWQVKFEKATFTNEKSMLNMQKKG